VRGAGGGGEGWRGGGEAGGGRGQGLRGGGGGRDLGAGWGGWRGGDGYRVNGRKRTIGEKVSYSSRVAARMTHGRGVTKGGGGKGS